MIDPQDQTQNKNSSNIIIIDPQETQNISTYSSIIVIILLLIILSTAAWPAMTLKGSGAGQACAVCKYQRRRCRKDCLLAPYFPADQPKVFQNAHRLFGVSNIQKILKEVHPDQREEAVKSIKYESYIRARFPVHGCCEVIWQLRYQLQIATEELRYVRARLAVFKAGGETTERSSNFTNPNNFLDDNALLFMPNEFVSNGGGYNGNYTYAETATDMKQFLNKQPHLQQFSYYNNFYDHGINGDTNDRNYNNNNNNHNNHNHNINDLQHGFLAHQEIDVPQDYDDELPFDTIGDDGPSYNESKEACESSAESMLKDEFVVENELKNAAACFSLKSMKHIEDRILLL